MVELELSEVVELELSDEVVLPLTEELNEDVLASGLSMHWPCGRKSSGYETYRTTTKSHKTIRKGWWLKHTNLPVVIEVGGTPTAGPRE